ncbi:hypothetical protein HMI54_013533 [Coelomomyces lativittatus]|nr:hypothetical protein HMI54_013533 [Coelomomyces lativittatus]
MKLNSTPNSTPNPTPNPTPNSNSNSNHKIKDININSPIFIKNSHGTHHPYSYLHDSDNVVDHNNLP